MGKAYETHDLTGKIALVTGANSGIGKVTARALAEMGAHVVLGCRNAHRGEAARAEIAEHVGAPERVELMLVDLSQQESIAGFAEAFTERFDRLDILVNNAGLIVDDRKETADGFEWHFGVNHLGTFALTVRLLPLLKAAGVSTGDARVVTVASEAHRAGGVDLTDLQWTRRSFVAFRVYGASKLCNILFASELARRLEGSGVRSHSLHPGAIASNFGSGMGGIFGLFLPVVRPFLQTNETGARTQIHLASSPDVAGESGHYYIRCKKRRPNGQARDMELARELWRVSVGFIGVGGDV